MKYPQRIRELREQANLSQAGLATATGISQSSIARWELGKAEPSASNIITLAKFFGESADYILGHKD